MTSLTLHDPQNASIEKRHLRGTSAATDSAFGMESARVEKAADRDWLALTSGMARGDANCFQVFCDAHFDLMFCEARRLLGRDEHTCLDIVQDALLKTMRSIRPIESQGQLQQWTRLVVRTTALDWLRKKQRLRESTIDSAGEPATISDDSSEATDQARMVWIEEQLRETAPEIRQLLSLRYRLGWTLKEIAGHLGMKTGAVDGRIRRAVEELKKQARLESDEL
jgi:RNA polymerase sigma-70 factor (ECF subfamily)